MRRRRLLVTAAVVVAAVVVAAVVVAVAGAGLFVETSAITSASGGIRLLQFNMCGHVCRDADRDKVGGVVESLADLHPAAASLNEVCRSQLTAIVAGTAERGWAMHARFIVTQPDECTGGADYGNAVLTRSPVIDTDTLHLRGPGPRQPGAPGSAVRRGQARRPADPHLHDAHRGLVRRPRRRRTTHADRPRRPPRRVLRRAGRADGRLQRAAS